MMPSYSSFAVAPPGPQTLLDSVLNSRRCRKTSLAGEDVWPVHLEAALLEGLERYVPDHSRETQLLRRFRGRNRFISEYILAKTGELRTNKQVGSRLQQLRCSAADPELRRLLFQSPSRSSTPSEYSTHSRDAEFDIAPNRVTISIHILPPSSQFNGPSLLYSNEINPARPINSIVPTATFLGTSAIVAQSYFRVWYGGECVRDTEAAPLTVLVHETADGVAGFLHSSVLVPKFWSTIVASPDPTQFVVHQDVVREHDGGVAYSAEYRFIY